MLKVKEYLGYNDAELSFARQEMHWKQFDTNDM